MVELEDLTDQDFESVAQLLNNHLDYTNSSRAKSILENWDKNKKKFRKVMPTDYKRALEMLAKEAEEAKIN